MSCFLDYKTSKPSQSNTHAAAPLQAPWWTVGAQLQKMMTETSPAEGLVPAAPLTAHSSPIAALHEPWWQPQTRLVTVWTAPAWAREVGLEETGIRVWKSGVCWLQYGSLLTGCCFFSAFWFTLVNSWWSSMVQILTSLWILLGGFWRRLFSLSRVLDLHFQWSDCLYCKRMN